MIRWSERLWSKLTHQLSVVTHDYRTMAAACDNAHGLLEAPALPAELVGSILEELYYSDVWRRVPDYASLCSCALVTSSWRAVAQQYLFSTVIQSVSSHFVHCVRQNSAEQRFLQHLDDVKVVELNLGHQEDQVGVQDMAILLERCPKLYELTLRIHGFFSVASAPSTVPLNTALEGVYGNIRSLRIMDCSIQSPIMYELLTIFPAVQFLTVGVEIAAAPPDKSLPDLHLYELILSRTLSRPILTWLLAASEGSLKVLELRDLPSRQTKEILEKHLPHLHSLRLMRLNMTTGSFLPLCTNLKELIIFNIPLLGVFMTPLNLPKTIEHLCVINQEYSTEVDWDYVVSLMEPLPYLNLLSCDRDATNKGHFENVARFCETRGVIMRIIPKRWPVSKCSGVLLWSSPRKV
jgi:hypothetical protein